MTQFPGPSRRKLPLWCSRPVFSLKSSGPSLTMHRFNDTHLYHAMTGSSPDHVIHSSSCRNLDFRRVRIAEYGGTIKYLKQTILAFWPGHVNQQVLVDPPVSFRAIPVTPHVTAFKWFSFKWYIDFVSQFVSLKCEIVKFKVCRKRYMTLSECFHWVPFQG